MSDFVTLVELLTLCAVGTQPALEVQTQRALGQVIQITSLGQPTWVHNATTGASYTPATTEEATALTRGLERSGHTVYVGIAAINTVWLDRYGYDLEQSFDACTELEIASEVLGTLIQKRRPKSQDDWHQLFATYLEPRPGRRTEQATIELSAKIALASPLSTRDERETFEPRGSYTLNRSMTVVAPVFPTQVAKTDGEDAEPSSSESNDKDTSPREENAEGAKTPHKQRAQHENTEEP